MEASDDEDDADSDKDFDYLMGKFQFFQVFTFSCFQPPSCQVLCFIVFKFSTFQIYIFLFPGMPMWSLTQERKDELCKKRWNILICFFVFDFIC